MTGPRRSIPAVGKVLDAVAKTCLARSVVVDTIRKELAALRESGDIPEFSAIVSLINRALEDLEYSRIQPVINGTGIIINTNLGRSPLAAAVMDSVSQAGSHYVNLEADLAGGRRDRRGAYVEHCLAILCGAEAATVVNNCAAALFLIVHHFVSPQKNEVIISRGELVQIGGSFRVPDIISSAGAVVREVGMTNKTSIADYESAISKNTAVILKVHRSNFFMEGFVESPTAEQICHLAAAKNVPYIEDLGSGAMVPTESMAAIEHAQTPAESLATGADLVCFSGDKLLGGPQAGIIAGKSEYVDVLKREPVARALRCDKLILAALQSTVDLYFEKSPQELVPVLSMLNWSEEALRKRAASITRTISCTKLKADVSESTARIGGGALPRGELNSVTVDLKPEGIALEDFARRLRTGKPPIFGYIADRCYRIDLRTVFPAQDHVLIQAINMAVEATVPGADR